MTEEYINFISSPRLLKILGGYMIKDHTTGIMELIKNGFDADAKNVIVTVRNPTQPSQTQIIVQDDGIGMTDDEVRGPWATAGTNSKQKKKIDNIKTAKGRTPLGEKGVGRFAAEKLGRHLKMVTRTADSDTEIEVSVNWDKFDGEKEKELSGVRIPIKHVLPKQFPDGKHGTWLKMTDLKQSKMTRKDMEALQASLLRLLAPDREYRDFDVKLECNEWPEVQDIDSTALWNSVKEKFQFKLVCDIMDNGKMNYAFSERDYKKPKEDVREETGKTDPWATSNPDDFNAGRKPVCGKFRIILYCWLLDVRKVLTPLGIKKEDISKLSGISLYRDGFRVIPYGDKGNDWLDLNLTRVNQPGKSLSSNQIVGSVEIDQTNNKGLIDKSSREGLIENKEYFEMRQFVKNALLELQNRMKPVRDEISSLSKQKKKVDTAVDDVKEQNKLLMEQIKTGQEQNKLLIDEIKGLKDAIAKLVKPADAPEVEKGFEKSAKLAAETSKGLEKGAKIVAQSNKTIKTIESGVKKLSGLPEYELTNEKRRNFFFHLMTLGHMTEAFMAEYGKHVGSMRKNLEALSEQNSHNTSVKAALNIAKIFDDDMKHAIKGRYERNDETTRVDDVIKYCMDTFASRAEKLKVKMDYEGGSGLETKMESHQLYKVLYELIDNAIYWTSTSETQLGKRRVTITVEEDVPGIVISNVGPEIPLHLRKSSLNDFESTTTKPDGSLGMGIWLSHQTMKEYDGEIKILDEEDELFRKDACFMIRLGC